MWMVRDVNILYHVFNHLSNPLISDPYYFMS